MTQRERIEQQIREVLAAADQAIKFSNCLFQPEGLFNQLATTEEERRRVASSPLFREAQRRLSELQKREAAQFAQAASLFRPLLRISRSQLPPAHFRPTL